MTTMNTRISRATGISALLAAALLALTGCTSTASDTTADSSAAEHTSTQAETITIEDAWVKAAEADAMTAGFGTLTNSGEHDVTIVSVSSSASPMIELHETVADASGAMVMQEVEGGFVIAADDHLHLEPGGNHFMFMGLPEALVAGEEVTITITFSDDSTLEYTAIVKDYAGANEEYAGDDHSDHSEH